MTFENAAYTLTLYKIWCRGGTTRFWAIFASDSWSRELGGKKKWHLKTPVYIGIKIYTDVYVRFLMSFFVLIVMEYFLPC